MEKKKFGLFIKESRIKQGLTQKDLAEKLYLDVTAVSKWERGVSYPDITLIPDLCKILDINEHELIESGNDTEYRKMKKDASEYNKIKNTIFYLSSILYVTALVVCFIVNIAVNKTLDWFWLVLSSCICGFSFLPTILRFFKKYKLSIFILSTFVSLFILFLTCSIYTKDYWFMVATTGTLLGYFGIFYPVLFIKQKNYLKEEKYEAIKKYFLLSYIVGLMVLTIVLLVFINIYNKMNIGGSIMVTLLCFSLGIVWGLVNLIKTNKLTKVGACILISGGFCYCLPLVLQFVIEDALEGSYAVNFSDWSNYSNGNSSLLILIGFIITGVTLLVLGIVNNKKKVS